MLDPSELLATLARRLAAASFTALDAAEVQRVSHGPLTIPDGLNTRTHRPERGGPLCMRLFGPIVDHCCMCGKVRGEDKLGVTCEKCGVTVAPASVRATRFGHIDLVVPLRHPWLTDAPIQRLLVLPPVLRLLPPERGDPDCDPDEHSREVIVLDARCVARTIDGLEPDDPPYPACPELTGTSALYARLIARNEAMRAMCSYDAPEVIREHEMELLQTALDALFGPPTLTKNPRGRRLRDLMLAALERNDSELDAIRLAAALAPYP